VRVWCWRAEDDGIVPRAAIALFQVVEVLAERGHEFSIALSVLELYNEQVSTPPTP
jgi:hypothetical protein